MFGLPLHRTWTKSYIEQPQCDTEEAIANPDPYGCCSTCTRVIKSALRLAEMQWNHYTMMISQDWKNIFAWGSIVEHGKTGRAPDGSDSNEPVLIFVDWAPGGKEDIVWLHSLGGTFGSRSISLFRTEQGSVYGTGGPDSCVLNGQTNRGRFQRLLTDVIDCYFGGQNTLAYIKKNGKAYALGAARPSGFGPNKINVALSYDDGTSDATYIGVDNASRIWTQSLVSDNGSGGGDVNRTKTFVLKNDGTVVATGYNHLGGLGVGSNSVHVTTWETVKTSNGQPIADVVDVITAIGQNTSYFLTKKGEVYVTGDNRLGALGLGMSTTANVIYATLVPNIKNGTLMCTSDYGQSVLVHTGDGEIYTWGNNASGQCGHGSAAGSPITTAKKVESFPKKTLRMVHGGGMYGNMPGAYACVADDGSLYVCGNNAQYALGVKNNADQNYSPNTFVRNDFFGFEPKKAYDGDWPKPRFPISVPGNNLTAKSAIVKSNIANDYLDKEVRPTGYAAAWLERVYVNVGYYVYGEGIPYKTYVTFVDRVKHEIHLSNPVLETKSNVTLTYKHYPIAYQADLCGYPGEVAMKVVTEDGTLFQSGWNQIQSCPAWNFNPRIGTEKVDTPTAFEPVNGNPNVV
jgi:alpha-tubulin suppressor-like RCC1 family protein